MKTLNDISRDWDLVVIGGGITGAGILREAVRNGFRTLLVEQKDFAWGTSSRSSKLVHGGLRYLREGKLLLTRESVRERERLLEEASGLVEPLDFMFPVYDDKGPGRWTMEAGLSIYDFIAGKWRHRFIEKEEFEKIEPLVGQDGLKGGFRFLDAQVDDARLVLRLIREAIDAGGSALNYTRAETLVRGENNKVEGVVLVDSETGQRLEVSTGAVINATGVWAERLHPSPEKGKHIRPLRGSHLIFPKSIVPVNNPISFFNPEDKRPLFAIPWEGVVLVGTTDIDHDRELLEEPSISAKEAVYILEAMKKTFPSLGKVTLDDCISTIAGVRPVLSEGKLDPSKESREHAVWTDRGLVTVTGGKLTTFRSLAWDALRAAGPFLRKDGLKGRKEPVFEQVVPDEKTALGLSEAQIRRLYGRYGKNAAEILKSAGEDDLREIPGTRTLWAELAYAAGNEGVRHLEDLLLRRVRVGLFLKNGGEAYFDRIREICLKISGWDDERWNAEKDAYMAFWQKYYSLPV